MYKAPFVSVTVAQTKRDLTDKVEGLAFEESLEKDNLMTINIKSSEAIDMIDDSDIVAGRTINCQFGFLEGEHSPVYTCKITDIETRYDQRIKLTVKALDAGHEMKKDSRGALAGHGHTTVFNDSYPDEIAAYYAKVYGLKPVIDKVERYVTKTSSFTTSVSDNFSASMQNNAAAFKRNYAQVGLTDYDFLKKIAIQVGYIFYITNKELHFHALRWDLKSKVTYTYGENIILFDPKYKETKQKGGGRNSQVSSIDPMNKKPILAEFSPKENTDTKLASYDQNGTRGVAPPTNEAPKPQQAEETNTGQITLLAASNSSSGSAVSLGSGTYSLKSISELSKTENIPSVEWSEAKQRFIVPPMSEWLARKTAENSQKTAGVSKQGASKVMIADFKVELNPNLRAGDIITIVGVAKKHGGNWRIEKITHKVPSSGQALSEMELSRNGTQKPIAPNPEKAPEAEINKSEGLRAFDDKGNRKTITTTQTGKDGKSILLVR